MNLSHLIELVSQYNVDKNDVFSELPNLSIYVRDDRGAIEAVVYEPVLCLILQGSKATSIGDQHVEIGPGDALLVSHDLPVVSRITKASKEEPYMAVILSLNLPMVRSLYEQVSDVSLPEASARSLMACKADQSWLAPLERYIALMDNPLDARVLGASVLREIHYRLLLSPSGEMLRRLLITDSHASRIAKAIAVLRSDYRLPLRVAALAYEAGMSASSFHVHFKSVTGTTPLQYQKDLRLIAAKTLIAENEASISEVAYAVGYESPTHFSRDYSKRFDISPKRDRNKENV